MIYEKLHDNPLKSRDDLARALENLIDPLFAHLSPSRAQVQLKSTGAHYQESSIGLEGFARSLYGTVPYILGGFKLSGKYKDIIENGLQSGSDPENSDYWGHPFYYRQNFIEMGSMALTIFLMADAGFYFSVKTLDRLVSWMSLMKEFNDLKNNNQLFFKLFTLMALRKIDKAQVSQDDIRSILESIDKSYIGGGWYNDGLADEDCRSVDYYNAMAFHYYGLIYSQLEKDTHREWSQKFRQRAHEFAKDFLYWFDQKGRAIPFGRSLTYRTAQSAFWSALAYADEEPLPWGQIKSLVLGNLRYWFRSPIFSESGLLTVGYGYPNLNMAEEYNSQVSSYWGLKPFLLLALPESHSFWSTKEEPVQKEKQISVQKHGRHILCCSFESEHLVLLNGGHWRKSCFQHIEEKYAKFAYSTHFGFNVATGNGGVDKKAPDNTLLFTDDGYYFKERGYTFDHEAGENYLASSFSPWGDVEVRTWMCPIGTSGHLRVHRVRSQRELECIEGGFSLPRTDAYYTSMGDPNFGDYFGSVEASNGLGRSMICDSPGMSCIIDPLESRTGNVILHAPNSNVLHQRAVIPTLRGKIPKGETYLVSLIFAHPDPVKGQELWIARPHIKQLADLMPFEMRGILQPILSEEQSDTL